MQQAIAAIEESGPTGWSLRELARRTGVSHAASQRHFRDKTALFTEIARNGWQHLAQQLEEAESRRHALSDVGKAYVRFAVSEKAHFEIICRPELYDAADSELEAARDRVFDALYGAAGHLDEPDPVAAGISAWALVHGLAVLHHQGMLPDSMGAPLDAFRSASGFMFR